MLHEEHVSTDRLARSSAGVPPEQAGDEAAEQSRQGQRLSDTADEEQRRYGDDTFFGVGRDPSQQQPRSRRQGQGDTRRFRD
jgi:hypothetical protein